MAEDLPIDIHYNKLLDWLISRRHCQAQWQKSIVDVREKISKAIEDMPAVDKITELLTGTHIHYFHCVTIVELLKETEGNNKDIFGRYSSQKIKDSIEIGIHLYTYINKAAGLQRKRTTIVKKDWMEILKLYEKDNIYLAEAAQLLARNVNFEGPALKKQIARCITAQEDSVRKEGDYLRLSTEQKEKFKQECKRMGIEGKKLKSELFSLVRNMPATFDEIAKETPPLLPAIEYYNEFGAYIRRMPIDEKSPAYLPLLRHVIKKGNTTVYEWKHGSAPQRVEPPSEFEMGLIDDEEGEGEQKPAEIDWGELDLNVEGSGDSHGIDLNIDLQVIDAATKYGVKLLPSCREDVKLLLASGRAISIKKFATLPETDGIDWSAVTDIGVELELAGDKTCPDKHLDEGTIRGEDARSLLDSVTTRQQFINDLYELEGFLYMRKHELTSSQSQGIGGSDIIWQAVLLNAPASILPDVQKLEVWLSAVTAVIDKLTNPHMKDLCKIRNSPRYVDRLVEKLKKISSDSEKMTSMSRLMVTKRAEALEEQRDTQPRLDLVIRRTKELQRQIEAEISKKYKNRRVNVMGEINSL